MGDLRVILNISNLSGEERAFLLEICIKKGCSTLDYDTLPTIKNHVLEKYINEIVGELTEEGVKTLETIKEKLKH